LKAMAFAIGNPNPEKGKNQYSEKRVTAERTSSSFGKTAYCGILSHKKRNELIICEKNKGANLPHIPVEVAPVLVKQSRNLMDCPFINGVRTAF